MENAWRLSTDRGDLRPSFHRDGGRRDSADPTIEISAASLPAGWLAIAVASASLIIIVLALAGVGKELRDHRRDDLEAERMRGLANAAVEGLLVCDGQTIVTVNDSFAALVGLGCKRTGRRASSPISPR